MLARVRPASSNRTKKLDASEVAVVESRVTLAMAEASRGAVRLAVVTTAQTTLSLLVRPGASYAEVLGACREWLFALMSLDSRVQTQR